MLKNVEHEHGMTVGGQTWEHSKKLSLSLRQGSQKNVQILGHEPKYGGRGQRNPN